MDLVGLLSSYQGRINRGKFWLAVLIFFIIGIILRAILYTTDMTLVGLIVMLVNLVVMISGIFVGIKRLHDRNKSGWWLLVLYVLPMILVAVGFYMTELAEEESMLAGLLSLLALPLFIWLIVELGCLRGTIGPNQYGPDPIAPQPATH